MQPLLEQIPGARELHDWFGYWPAFHDAEVISLKLHRADLSSICIHTWEMTDKLDERGFYILRKHVLVTFELRDVFGLQLSEFNSQNVISGLQITQVPNGFEIGLGPCYGLSGSITAKHLSIRLGSFAT